MRLLQVEPSIWPRCPKRESPKPPDSTCVFSPHFADSPCNLTPPRYHSSTYQCQASFRRCPGSFGEDVVLLTLRLLGWDHRCLTTTADGVAIETEPQFIESSARTAECASQKSERWDDISVVPCCLAMRTGHCNRRRPPPRPVDLDFSGHLCLDKAQFLLLADVYVALGCVCFP